MEGIAKDERHPWNRTIGDLLHFLVLLFFMVWTRIVCVARVTRNREEGIGRVVFLSYNHIRSKSF